MPEQIPIRCELDFVSAPPVVPIDANTGAQVKFWRSQDVAYQVGVFDVNGVCVSMANLLSLQLLIQSTPTSPFPLINKVVTSDDIIPFITRAGWTSGSDQQATFILSSAETDVGLNGKDSEQFWLIIRGVTLTGNIINYGGGYIRIYNPGNTLALIMPGIVTYHRTTNSTGTSTVTPTSLIHTEEITISGAATVRNFLVDPAQWPAGSQVWLKFTFPTPLVAGIVLNVYSGSLSGELLLTYTTDAFQANALVLLNEDGLGGFSGAMLVSPSFPSA